MDHTKKWVNEHNTGKMCITRAMGSLEELAYLKCIKNKSKWDDHPLRPTPYVLELQGWAKISS